MFIIYALHLRLLYAEKNLLTCAPLTNAATWNITLSITIPLKIYYKNKKWDKNKESRRVLTSNEIVRTFRTVNDCAKFFFIRIGSQHSE